MVKNRWLGRQVLADRALLFLVNQTYLLSLVPMDRFRNSMDDWLQYLVALGVFSGDVAGSVVCLSLSCYATTGPMVHCTSPVRFEHIPRDCCLRCSPQNKQPAYGLPATAGSPPDKLGPRNLVCKQAM
jgi:hypothetical protein